MPSTILEKAIREIGCGFTQGYGLTETLEATFLVSSDHILGGSEIQHVAEVHDCFSISEIIIMEELGFTEKGNGGEFVLQGCSTYGGEVVINPRGGLLGCGHPLGATGVAPTFTLF